MIDATTNVQVSTSLMIQCVNSNSLGETGKKVTCTLIYGPMYMHHKYYS